MAATLPQSGNLIRLHSTRKFPTFRNLRETWTRNPNPRHTHLLIVLHLQHHYHFPPPHPRYRLPVSHSHSHSHSLFGFYSPPSSSSISSMAITTQAASDPPPSSPTKTVRVVVKGRVQGVFYRNWTMDNAKELGLKGWVRNRRDGSVEALFSGNPDSVQEMEQRCRRGPPAAVVTGLQVSPCTDDPGTGFERKSTA